MKRRALLFLFFIVLPALLCVVTLLSSYFVIQSWWVELLSFTMLAVLLCGLGLIVALVFIRPGPSYWWLPVLAFVLATKPWSETLRFHFTDPKAAYDLSVMSFNAALFNPDRGVTLESDVHRFDEFYTYLRNNPSPDILCIQEFYHSAEDDRSMTADSIVKLGGYSYFYTNPRYDEDYRGLVGVITFAKFPAVGNGRVWMGDENVHNGSWVDFAVRGDTVRIFNTQLRSMSIRWKDRPELVWYANIAFNLHSMYRRLYMGYEARMVELAGIERFLESSRHPAIVCADINALPYSNTYQALNTRYDNAFERAGSGFGFTYRNFPWFTRIDNQFFDPRLGIVHFEVTPDISISDHYPIMARYTLPSTK